MTMRKGKGGEGQKDMKRNGRDWEGDEKKEKLCPCSLQKSTDKLNAKIALYQNKSKNSR